MLIREGKGGHERLVPLSPTFFATVARYMDHERPETTSDALFVRSKGTPRPSALDARPRPDHLGRTRAGGTVPRHLPRTASHLLHPVREAGMAIEAIQAQAGHRSITSTRVYLHLSVDWLDDEYRRAAEAIEAQALVGVAQ